MINPLDLLSTLKKSKPIWLFSENCSKTMSNNGYYFWRYVVNHSKSVEAYFVIESNAKERSHFEQLNSNEKRHVVEKNSLMHHLLFLLSDLNFCSLSYTDVLPDHIFFKKLHLIHHAPLVYVGHGVTGFKMMGYKSNYANNCLYRYLTYNSDKQIQKGISVNFKDYQCLHGGAQPRYQELVQRQIRYGFRKNIENILWFLTWREFTVGSISQRIFNKKFKGIVLDSDFHDFLRTNKLTLTICLHAYFKKDKEFQKILEEVPRDCMVVRYAGEIDVMDEIVKNDILITDYSSLAYDFAFLKKPVITFPFDWDEYYIGRKFYCDINEFKEASCQNLQDLVYEIQSQLNEPRLNQFFSKQIEIPFDYKKIAEGEHIKNLYDYFLEKQKNQIVFWGYDFTGIGGTVFATKALAEGLLERGHMVKLLCLKQAANGVQPSGLVVYPMCKQYKPSRLDKFKNLLFNCKRNLSILKHDPALSSIKPVSGWWLDFWLKHKKFGTVVSTRESIHYAVNESCVENKIYFFHTAADCVDKIFPGCIEDFQSMELPKVAFVTENNRLALKDRFGFNSYKAFAVVGNSLDSSRMLDRDYIEVPNYENGLIECAYLLRISKERTKDIDRLIRFAKYVKEKKAPIVINVYGRGDYVNEFIEKLVNEELYSVVRYKGPSNDVKSVYKNNLCTVDFAYVQSFGMTYIESILNGRMCYAFENEGSRAILSSIGGVVLDEEDLLQKLLAIPTISKEILLRNYDLIYGSFSRSHIAEKFEKLLEK